MLARIMASQRLEYRFDRGCKRSARFRFAGADTVFRPVHNRLVRIPVHSVTSRLPGDTLRPTAIQFGQIQAAVNQDFHAAGSAGFPRSARGINPEIDTLHQIFSGDHVVVTQKIARSRISGRRIKWCQALISAWPGKSAGWALPDTTNCTGRSGLVSMAASRSGSVSSKLGVCKLQIDGQSRWSLH